MPGIRVSLLSPLIRPRSKWRQAPRARDRDPYRRLVRRRGRRHTAKADANGSRIVKGVALSRPQASEAMRPRP